ncbi:MAG: GDP-mannose 4,6-dehydratase [Parcubacteria group bacterium]|nr:GDP-mannose 4,6-dehydratase [Parcubacteria group bacterium]
MGKCAFITGVCGQDGGYLAELLLKKGYTVHGLAHEETDISHDGVILHLGNILDSERLREVIEKVRPDEVYNFAAQSSVYQSFQDPVFTGNVTGLGALRVLEAVRQLNPDTKFFQASSSEVFGCPEVDMLCTEKTPFNPRNPYGNAKVFAQQSASLYRDAFGMFVCNGILFNHESPRRPERFVTRKITSGVARIKAGKQDVLSLGNIDVKRDWGYAPEYVEAMWKMLQQEEPGDYVLATGEAHTIEEFIKESFLVVGIEDWEKCVELDEINMRPSETAVVVGDASKAKDLLGWEPRVGFKELVRIMVEADLSAIIKEMAGQ